MRTCYAVIFLCASIVLFSNVAFAEDDASTANVIVDYEGKPITEAEIRAYMVSDYRPGCCLLGGAIGSAASFLLGCVAGAYLFDDVGEDAGVLTWLAIWGVGTIASGSLSYKYGKEIDRRKAVELVREERQTGKKPPQPKRKFLPGVMIGFGVAGAAILVVGLTQK